MIKLGGIYSGFASRYAQVPKGVKVKEDQPGSYILIVKSIGDDFIFFNSFLIDENGTPVRLSIDKPMTRKSLEAQIADGHLTLIDSPNIISSLDNSFNGWTEAAIESLEGTIKVVDPVHWSGNRKPQVVLTKVKDAHKYEDITLKSLAQLISEYDIWFDMYGNMVSEHGHLAPSYFDRLGKTFSVKTGCGFTLPECAWLRVPTPPETEFKPEFKRESKTILDVVIREGDVYFGIYSRYFGGAVDQLGLIDKDKMCSYAIEVVEIVGFQFSYRSFAIHKDGSWKVIDDKPVTSFLRVLVSEINGKFMVKADESEIKNMPRL